MAWRPTRGQRRIVVGEIKKTAQTTSFSYIQKGVEEASKLGFICFPDFPDTSKTYNTNIICTLSQRVNNSERSDIEDYYRFWEIPQESKGDIYRMLAYTGGILATDNFEFLVDFYSIKNLTLVSEVSGLSVTPLENETIKVRDILLWERESDNQYDSDAVAIYKGDTKIGYVKRIHARIFQKVGKERLQIVVKKIEHNGHINKAYIAIRYV